MKKMKKIFLISTLSISIVANADVSTDWHWPKPTNVMKPWVYNWWMGSVVSSGDLRYQMDELKDKGFGGLHVVPIYGAKGFEKQYRPFLSQKWIEGWNYAAKAARSRGLDIDLSMGSGWCFGGPWIDVKHATSSKFRVKRAGPGGEGFMLDPFSPEAMSNHVARFESAFGKNGKAERPRAFYHDSYEYYGAKPKRGGDIEELQIATFKVWSDWCRKNGYITRNEAHGAPTNWLDLYALSDIPETEMFAKGDRDILISKFASSSAHVKGTRLVSAESCTWIDEHFCERPREIKLFIDRLFLSGVNHVFYHGLCYSPRNVVWPGWCFYASLEMNPRNPIWREIKALNEYITRCQSIFQTWECDNDLALIWDTEKLCGKNRRNVRPMSVHERNWFYKSPIGEVAKTLFDKGYAFDYISPRMLNAGLGEKYVEIIDPEKIPAAPLKARKMPFDASSGLMATRWRKNGKILYFVVNQSDKGPVEVVADEDFVAMDPLSGEIGLKKNIVIYPNHSYFIADARGLMSRSEKIRVESDTMLKCGNWKVEPIVGGPKMPPVKVISNLVGWHIWDEAFSGTMRYSTSFDANSDEWKKRKASRKNLWIDFGDVREIARVKINGKDLGVKFMPPYKYCVALNDIKEKGNVLEVEVTNLGANRLRWNDLNKVKWKYFRDINIVGLNYKTLDASKYKVMESGLLGPLTICK
jgi:hypothetical protein